VRRSFRADPPRPRLRASASSSFPAPPHAQRLVFAGNLTFGTPAEQEGYVLAWLADRAGVSAAELGGRLQLRWYGARYHASKGSVLALGDLTQHFGPGESGVCVLEEPEHLNWYHHGERWCGRWQLVIGIIHTNYWSYTRSHETGGLMAAALTQQINRWLCGGYCHKSIKLSDALPPLPRSVTENTHGVRDDFLKLGARVGEALEARRAGAARGEGSLPAPPFSKGMYFIGKALWAKGHRELFQLLGALAAAGAPGASAAAAAGGVGGGLAARRLGGGVGGSLTLPRGGGASTPPEFDVYGSGADKPSIELAAAALAGRVTIRMHGGIDHADSALHAYKVGDGEVGARGGAGRLAEAGWVHLPAHRCVCVRVCACVCVCEREGERESARAHASTAIRSVGRAPRQATAARASRRGRTTC
jgi:hypothetical protein